MASRGRPPSLLRDISRVTSSLWAREPIRHAVLRRFYTKIFDAVKNTQENVNISSPRHTIFTLPGATKDLVLDAIRKKPQSPQETAQDVDQAAVILASPQHASWLTHHGFMTALLSSLHAGIGRGQDQRHFHVLAAVVDGLCPTSPTCHRQMQEGLSIQLGTVNTLLPGLWSDTIDTSDKRAPSRADSEASYISVKIKERAHLADKISINLPLANTLFQNGRRSTLLASEWKAEGRDDPSTTPSFRLLRMVEKRSQTIDVPASLESRRFLIRSPLVPITHPRLIVEGLGNILAKVKIDQDPSPASKELQTNIPLLLEARRSRLQSNDALTRPGVWALIIPEKLITPQGGSLKASSEAMGSFGLTGGKLAFQTSTLQERTARRMSSIVGDILLKGGRLHRIMSGGGEWGAKASLLSLDPQTSYGLESEHEELLRFQKSFYGNDEASEATAKPGDFVQFFVDGNADVALVLKSRESVSQPAHYPTLIFGVGDLVGEELKSPGADESVPAGKRLAWLAPDHFGGFSAEGLYIDSPKDKLKTKLDAPGTSVSLVNHVNE